MNFNWRQKPGGRKRSGPFVLTALIIFLSAAGVGIAAPASSPRLFEGIEASTAARESHSAPVLENREDRAVRIQWRFANRRDWSSFKELPRGEQIVFRGETSIVVRVAAGESRSGWLLKSNERYRIQNGKIVRVVASAGQTAPAFSYVPRALRPALATLGNAKASRDSREQAARELAAQGASATPGLMSLMLSHDRDPVSAGLAAGALARIGGAAAPALVRMMTESSADTANGSREVLARENRRLASEALAAMGPKAAPELQNLLQNAERPARDRALAADILGRIHPAELATVRALSAATEDKNEMVRRHAQAALKRVTLRFQFEMARKNGGAIR